MEIFLAPCCERILGGAVDRIDVDPIAHPDQDQAAAKKELTVHLATFNAAKAQCFMQADHNTHSRRQGMACAP